jgi:hypothetical protein
MRRGVRRDHPPRHLLRLPPPHGRRRHVLGPGTSVLVLRDLFLPAAASDQDAEGEEEVTWTPDTSWPCRCELCASPTDCCEACGAKPGEVCDKRCSEHPSNKRPYTEMLASGLSQPAIEEHW